jgi:ribonuclease Z
MDIQLTAFSLPMFSTWVYVHPLRLLIDAGDGVSALMGQKIHGIDTIALTHAHRDHVAGLPQLINLRGGGEGHLRIVHPGSSRSIQQLREFSERFDAQAAGRVEWVPVARRAETDLPMRNCVLRNFPVKHIPEPDEVRSRTLGYHVIERKRKLRPELAGLPQAEVDRIRIEKGQDAIVAPVEEKVISASGDTVPIDPEEYRGAQVLLHECTFLRDIDRDENPEEGRDHWHSTLPEVLDLARAAGPGALVLYHISQRYAAGEIAEVVGRAVRSARLPFPVYAIFPGRFHRDVMERTIDERPPRRGDPDRRNPEPAAVTAPAKEPAGE